MITAVVMCDRRSLVLTEVHFHWTAVSEKTDGSERLGPLQGRVCFAFFSSINFQLFHAKMRTGVISGFLLGQWEYKPNTIIKLEMFLFISRSFYFFLRNLEKWSDSRTGLFQSWNFCIRFMFECLKFNLILAQSTSRDLRGVSVALSLLKTIWRRSHEHASPVSGDNTGCQNLLRLNNTSKVK